MRRLLRREPEIWALGILLLGVLIVGNAMAGGAEEPGFQLRIRPDFEPKPPVVEFIRIWR
jgi:hypothetical protein